MNRARKNLKFYWTKTVGACIGLVASFVQTMDKLTLLKDDTAALTCNISDVLSCSTVLGAEQASVLGPPNSLISIVLFSFMLAVGLVGLTGGSISKVMRAFTQFLALFTLAFGMWFLYQSIFVIQSLCVYCIFNTFGLLLINAAWLRINYADIGTKTKLGAAVNTLVTKNYDTLIWASIAVLIAAVALFRFT